MEIQTARLLSSLSETELVTYRERHQDYPFLDDLLSGEPALRQVLWIVSWGFDVPVLIRRCGAIELLITPIAVDMASRFLLACRCWR